MNSEYNKINNNNNNNQHHHYHHRGHHTHYAPENGLNFFLTGLKMLNQKSGVIQPQLLRPSTSLKQSSPPSPTATQSLLQHTPRSRSYQTAANVAVESAHFCETFMLHGHQNLYSQQQLQQQQQQHQQQQLKQQKYHHHHHHHHKYEQPLNKILSQRKNSPPEPIHNASTTNNRLNHNNNITANNQQHLQNCVRVYQPQLEHHQKRSIAQSYSKTTRNISTEQHYQHYYSYYYNRDPTAGRDSPTATTPSESKPGRKLPTHKMATTKTDYNAISQDGHNTKRDHHHTNKYQMHNSYQTNVVDNRGGGDGSGAQHVLREKMPNNNIITTKQFSSDDWYHGCVDDEDLMNAAGDFIDVKDFDASDEQFIQSDDGLASKLPALVLNKCQLNRLQAGNDNNANKNYNIDAETNGSHSGAALRREIKLPATPIHTKAHGAAVPFTQKKQSPPAHRVLIYNNSLSPRAPMRHSPRLSPSTSRMQEVRRIRAKSPSFGGIVIPKTKPNQHIYTNRLVESNKNTSADCYVHETKTLINQKTIISNKNCDKQDNARANKNDLDDNAAADANDNDSAVDSNTDDEFDDDLDNISDFDDSYSTDSSSDYENGFRTQSYKITQSLDKISFTTDSNLSNSSSDEGLMNPESFLVPSLFPNVPPYLAFSSNTTKGPEVPAELYRILKWRVTNVMPKVVRCVLANSGVRLLKKTNDWMGTWGKHMKSPCFKTIRPYQKINHLPGSFKIGRKDACWKNLQKQMNRHGRRDFGFMPKTFVIPNDLNLLRKSWPKYAQRNVKWIIKPPASARGTGIRVVNRWAQIPKRKPLIVQKYIERPLLINGSKFDLRLYVLVTSINPLRVFMYHNGLARFASVKYSDKSDTLNDRCMHLTNYSINKFSSNYSKNEDVNACHGHKWTLKSLWSYLANRGIRTDLLWDALRNLVLRTILAGENSINNMIKMNVESKYSTFELFGFDVLLDSELIPWLLEVNISPSLHSELPLDAHVKAPLVQGVLNTALYNIPPKLTLEKQKEMAVKLSLPAGPICFDKRLYINYLSRAEKMKHNAFTRKSMEDRDEYINAIIEHLTPDDVRCLIIAEDELARCSPLERIFPTTHTHKYLKYTDTPRYYNRLLDAWECRYGNNRIEGINLLRKYCSLRYHLEVPPIPAKKYFEDDDTTYYLPPEQEHIESTAAPNIQDSNVNGDTTINTGCDICSEENTKIEFSKASDAQSADVASDQNDV